MLAPISGGPLSECSPSRLSHQKHPKRQQGVAPHTECLPMSTRNGTSSLANPQTPKQVVLAAATTRDL